MSYRTMPLGRQILLPAMLLLVLVLFAMNYRSERGYGQWFKQWEAERKARRDAELAAERGEDQASSDGRPRGPWG